MCVCVLFLRGPLHLVAGGAVRGCVLGPGSLPRPATPGLGCRGVCLFVWAPHLYPAIPGSGARCGRACWARVSAVLLPSWLGCWGMCVFLRVPRLHPFLPGRRLWRRGVQVLSRVGFAPPVPFGVCTFFGGGAPWRVVSWLCGVGRWLSRSWFSWFLSPLPLSLGLRLRVFFDFFLPQRGVCRRVRGVPSSGGPLLPFWCCRVLAGWSSGAPPGGPVLGAVWLAGLAAFCGVGGRFRGCGPLSCPPPPPAFFWGGVRLFLPLPSLGWCMHWSAFGLVFRVAVGVWVSSGLAQAPWVGWVMYTLGSASLPAGLGSGSAGWAVALGGSVRLCVRGAGAFCVLLPPRCRL